MGDTSIIDNMTSKWEDSGNSHITVAHPSFPNRLPLIRLNRNGLVFRADSIPLIYGLPRPTMLFGRDTPLCALRLVIRHIASHGSNKHELTMQPSCAVGNELLWHTLRTHRLHQQAGMLLSETTCSDTPKALNTDHPEFLQSFSPSREKYGENAMQSASLNLSRSAVFRLAHQNDALFFMDWLEYHFDELWALAQNRSPQLHLQQLERHLKNDGVDVRFIYTINGYPNRHMLTNCAWQTCHWIETEIRQRFDMPIAQERFGPYYSRPAHSCEQGMTSRRNPYIPDARYSFSSK